LADIQGMQFKPTSNASGVTAFQFNVYDSGGTANGGADNVSQFILITVNAINDASTITNLSGDSLSYSEGDGPLVIEQSGNALVADVDSANLDTGTLTVSIPAGGNSAEDVLSIQNQGTGAGQIGVSGSNVTYQGVTIGTFTGGSNGSDLVITLNSSATPTRVTALVKTITYENTDTAAPTTGARTVRYVLTDGDGGTSANYDTTVTVSGVNDAPRDLALSASTVAENAATGTVVGTITGTDVDTGDTKTYSFTDAAGGRFAINSSTGVITVANGSLLNYEAATSHTVTVRVTDSGGLTYDEAFTINLTNVNEAPTGTDATVTISEDISHTLTTANFGFSDVDAGDSLSAVRIDMLPGSGTLTLSGVAVTAGQVVTVADINAGNVAFTPSADANGTGYATLTFSVRDSNNAYDAAPNSLTFDVTAVNDAPVNTVPGAQNVAEDTSLALSGISVTDVDGNLSTAQLAVGNGTLTVTLSGGATISAGANGGTTLTLSGSQTDINATLASLRYQGSLNFNGADTLTVTSTDSNSVTDVDTVTITVGAVNDTPTDLALSANTVAENVANGTVVGTVSGTDVDTGDTKTYSLTDTAGGRFTINSSTGVITVANGSLLNYEAASSHSVTVRETDSGGLTYDEAFTINLTNVNEAPTDLALSANTVAENAANGTVVGTITGTDPDSGDTKSYSFTDSAGGRFAVNSSTGVITVADGTLLNYEAATSHTVTVRVTDSGGLTYDETFTINLTNVNETPTGADATVTINEDTSHTLTTANFGFSDVDAGDSLSAVRIDSLPGAGSLTLSGVTVTAGQVITVAEITAGNLVFTPAADGNGIGYASVTFSVRDSNNAYDAAHNSLVFDVTAVNDAPVNTVPGAQTVNEDTPVSLAGLSVSDVDGNLSTVQLGVANGTVTVTLAGAATISAGSNGSTTLTLSGTQADINATLASLVYQGSLNYTGADTLTVTSTDSNAMTDVDTVALTVTAQNDAPTDLTLSANTVAENAANGTVVGTVAGTDVDAGDTKAYSLTDTAGGRFAINSSTGQITVANGSLLNYEAANSHSVIVRVTDSGGLTYDEAFTINLTNVNEAPAGTDATVTINEDTSHTLTISDFGFSDVDAGDLLSAVRIDTLPGAGTLTLFGIAVTAGQVVAVADITAGDLVFTPVADANGTGYATMTFSVRDASSIYDIAPNMLTFDVTAQNDAPTLAVNTGSTAAEGGFDTISSGELLVTDVDNTAAQLTFSVGTGPASGRLELTTSPGVSANSFTQADIIANRLVYVHDGSETTSDTFTFTVNDGAGGAVGSTTVTLTITPVNDTPTITSGGGGSTASVNVAENVTGIMVVTGADVDLPAQTLTHGISGGADQALFTIDTATGALSFVAPSDFEVATDANGDNMYVVQVRVADGQGGAVIQTIQVTVTDVAEGTTPASAKASLLPSLIPTTLSPVPSTPPSSPLPAGPESPAALVPSNMTPTGVPGISSVPPTLHPGETSPGAAFRPNELRHTDLPVKDHSLPRWNDDQPSSPFTIIPVEAAGSLQFEEPSVPSVVSDVLMAKLDAMATSLEEAIGVDQEQHALVVRVATLTGVTLSVGFVAWALQSSTLLASCLATLPAWKNFDPLPVVSLSRLERNRRQKATDASQQHEQAEFDGLQDLFDSGASLKPKA
jgi:hypothetical protein